ncbi:transcription factor 15 [Dermatophagoides farinae]|uniref:transcription factor 15 n=1 Tax=Dermatophagoides farinae TaxID=6954 RepID=UPI003F612789
MPITRTSRRRPEKSSEFRQQQEHQKLYHRMIANERERNRTESVNKAFNRLRRLLPTIPLNRKLSKIEILRLATSYIQHLNNVCLAITQEIPIENICSRLEHEQNSSSSSSSSSQKRSVCTFCITTLSSMTNGGNYNNEIELNSRNEILFTQQESYFAEISHGNDTNKSLQQTFEINEQNEFDVWQQINFDYYDLCE